MNVGLRPHPANAGDVGRKQAATAVPHISRNSFPMPLATPTNEPAPRKRAFWTMARREGLAGYLFVAPQAAGTITVRAWCAWGSSSGIRCTSERAGRHLQVSSTTPTTATSRRSRRLPEVLGATAIFFRWAG